jgi:hypothetical protein
LREAAKAASLFLLIYFALSNWIVIQTAKATENAAVPMDATSAMIDISTLPDESVME